MVNESDGIHANIETILLVIECQENQCHFVKVACVVYSYIDRGI